MTKTPFNKKKFKKIKYYGLELYYVLYFRLIEVMAYPKMQY